MPPRKSPPSSTKPRPSPIFFSLFFWLLFLIFVTAVPPLGPIQLVIFFILLFLTIYATSLIVIRKARINLLIPTLLISLLSLKLVDLLTPITLILALALFLLILLDTC